MHQGVCLGLLCMSVWFLFYFSHVIVGTTLLFDIPPSVPDAILSFHLFSLRRLCRSCSSSLVYNMSTQSSVQLPSLPRAADKLIFPLFFFDTNKWQDFYFGQHLRKNRTTAPLVTNAWPVFFLLWSSFLLFWGCTAV